METEREYTVEELTGETEQETPAPGTEEKPAESAEEKPGEETPAPPPEAKPTEEKPAETKPAEEKPAETKPAEEKPAEEPTKPPPGYVRQEALREEREKRKELQRQIEALKAKIPQEPVKTAKDLILEDPEASIAVLQEQIETLRGEISRRDLEKQVNEKVPDFLEKAPLMEDDLRERGFDDEAIANIIGASGKFAPQLFQLFSEALDAKGSASTREAIAAELTPKITAEVTKQLMAKFNLSAPPTNIGKIPGGAPTDTIHVDGEKDYEKLTPEQQAKWLQGGL